MDPPEDKINLNNRKGAWKDPPVDLKKPGKWTSLEDFDQQASLEIARKVLYIFAGVYAICFVFSFFMLSMADEKFDKSLELIRFMIGSILPLATLAVGYYLGDKSST